MTTDKTNNSEQFRDKLATVDEKGKRIWIYPKKPKGPFYNARTIVSILLLAFLFITPFIKVGGEPLLLFNVIERKFIIFGLTFWPQDFFLFGLAMLTFIIFIVLFTVVFGRVFCGWACPQTIFMEMVFRKIEYWIEGDAGRQKALDKASWNREKIIKKGIKHIIFAAIAFLIGNTFLAYIIGIDQLVAIVTAAPSEHLSGFTAMIIFSGAFYYVFAFFREQACTTVCPYGRLQGVLLDSDSIVVAYDFARGEPRGKIRKSKTEEATPPLGDCIDCSLCVHVCPTGIDIRNGTQLECVNCTACIDACDEVMEKVGRPKKLIKYASYNNIASGKKGFHLTPRIIAYTAVLFLLMGILGFSLAARSDFETTLLRTPGMLFQKTEDGRISNLYNIQIVNKTKETHPITLKQKEPPGEIQLVGNEMSVQGRGMAEGALFIKIEKGKLKPGKNKVVVEVYSGEKKIDEVTTNFMAP